MARTDTPMLVCLDCAKAEGSIVLYLGLYQPYPGRCDVCGRCTLVIAPNAPESALDTWRGP